MELYHGSVDIVATPEIRIPDRTLDYGIGFYLTTSFDQAEKWVRRKLINDVKTGWVNVYDYSQEMEAGLSVLSFDVADENWLDFVISNRMDVDFSHSYDIVKGPVADDRVYASFALYEAGLLSKNALIEDI